MDAAALLLSGAGAGLLAGGTTCAAVQLGLLTGAVRGAPGGSRPRDAVAPVAAFLTAKLLVHTALGALLGLVGAALQPGPRARGLLLVLAAALLVLFAFDLLGARWARRLLRRDRPAAGAGHCAPRPGGMRRPAVLGAATVLVPCGLTLSAEVLAVASRSPVGGAAVMAGFVLGTVPLFGLLGVTLGRALALLRGRLTALAGVALLAVAAWTATSGLRLAGWAPSAGAAGTDRAVRTGAVRTDAAGVQEVTVWALDRGYRPALVTARAGVRTVLVVRTSGTRGHTRAFTIPGRGLDVVLPVSGETRIDLGAPGPGRMRFVCASGHYPGTITFR